MGIFALAIFVSSFLIFQVQPMIGKFILPWYGSSPGVWMFVFLFFQLLLVGGYAYAHFLNCWVPAKKQVLVHLSLLAAVLLLLPVTPSDRFKPSGSENPMTSILLLLTVTVGAPYTMLATTAPLLQSWFAARYPGRTPYRLYAVSNIGSLLALLSYPFIVEPLFTLKHQTLGWSCGFGLFVLLTAFCARSRTSGLSTAPDRATPRLDTPSVTSALQRPGVGRYLLWLTLSAFGSIVLMATSNRISQDVPPVPFLFILPLSLYLITFIIAFENPQYYRRMIFIPLLWGVTLLAVILSHTPGRLSIPMQIGIYSGILFALCMVCHGELAKLRPDPAFLTHFFLTISLGGALGGTFVAILSPLLFSRYTEFEIGWVGTYGLVMSVVIGTHFQMVGQARRECRSAGMDFGTVGLEAFGNLPGDKVELVMKAQSLPLKNWALSLASLVWMTGLGLSVFDVFQLEKIDRLSQSRNFYGCIRVRQTTNSTNSTVREMGYGSTLHGVQFTDPNRHRIPTTYFGPESGIGLALRFHPGRNLENRQFRIGVVGLGTGTLAAYLNADKSFGPANRPQGDFLCFYELNPLVVNTAEKEFTYLNDARRRGAEIELRLGDARIVLEEQLRRGLDRKYDLLAVDAFISDAIPMHLLTTECFDLYLKHLNPDGILAFHITNPIDLLPVVRASARKFGLQEYFIHNRPRTEGELPSKWVLVTKNEKFIDRPEIRSRLTAPTDRDKTILWTDDFHSLFQVFRSQN